VHSTRAYTLGKESCMSTTRRTFLYSAAAIAASALGNGAHAADKPIQGFEKSAANAPAADASKGYQPGPYSNREELLIALDQFVLDRLNRRPAESQGR